MGLGVCLAAGELFRSVFGQSTRCRRVSAWDFDDGDDATVGPTVEPKPLDVGDVAVVGAGAVGSAFCYWAAQLGHTGRWTVIDQDKVELHNTNRCMGLVATDAGWPDGQPSGMPVSKAQAAARLVIADSYDGWYHDWLETCSERPDLVLPLANEFGVRHAIGQRAEPIIVHATTSANWTAELHRHIAGRDDCIDCRLPARSESNFRCSTGLVPAPTETVTPNDAALPFLSGAAGLMLLVALVQLEHGAFAEHRRNHWRLLFGPAERAWSSSTHRCLEECRSQVAPAVRKKVNADRRWAHLDTPTRRSDEL
jgi:molybdopterin/thiamine biosynthesis adenylyltransferase